MSIVDHWIEYYPAIIQTILQHTEAQMGQIFSLTSTEAEKIIAAAIGTLESQLDVASIVLVNRDETEIAKTVMDGVKPLTARIAFMKARQAAWTGKPTDQTRNDIAAGKFTAISLGINPEELVPWAGGVPIYDQEGHLLGGIGVSNLAQEKDKDVAENAVVKAGFKVCP